MGKSPQFPALLLLIGEYAPSNPINSFAGLVMGKAISSLSGGGSFPCHAPLRIGYQRMYLNQILAYMRRAGAALHTCGNPIVFAGKLPTRAVHAAAQATIHPNSAADTATLPLAAPARSESALRLTDALGCTV